MIELQEYSISELKQILSTNNKQSTERKLTRWGISYSTKGYGANLRFTITKIKNPFKVYCILHLGFAPNSDFQKVRNLYYYFFNDEEFMAMPDEVKEARMEEYGRPLSRQSIAHYIAKLDAKGFVHRNTGEYIYYFALHHQQRIVDRSEYLKAWHEYWENKDNGMDYGEAISLMILNYGGIARKQEIPTINGIYLSEVEYIQNLIQESLENEQAE